MVMVTLHKGQLRKIGAVCACAALLVATAFGVNAIFQDPITELTAATPTSLEMQVTNATEVTAFFQGYGVEVDAVSATVNTVTVPKKWDDSFVAFNECIKESGLDLSDVKGKDVDKWMVLVPSQSTDTLQTYAVALVYKEVAVAAYYLQKPSGEVLPMPSNPLSGGALTEEEKAANASFGADVPALNTQESEATTQEPVVETVNDMQPTTQETAAAVEELSNDGAFPTE